MHQNLKILILALALSFSAHCFGQDSNIKKIEYSFHGYAGLPKYEIIFYSDKTAIFHAISGNYGKPEYESELVGYGTMYSKDGDSVNIRATEVKGIFKTQLEGKKWITILKLIEPLHIEFEQKSYPSKTFHSPTVILRVYYNDGAIKSIHDSSGMGTKQLGELYSFLNGLRFSEQWE